MELEEQRSELRRFFKHRRARLAPADVGLRSTGRRRVPGLRREEVALLAGIGVSWYTALENGEADGVSEATLTAIAAALRLSESEREYLMALGGRLRAAEEPEKPDSLVVAAIDAIAFPAYIISANWEIVSATTRSDTSGTSRSMKYHSMQSTGSFCIRPHERCTAFTSCKTSPRLSR
jgi:transcriptional regulator with XRE-family HTH domain